MAKMSPEAKTRAKEAARHPVKWWRGVGLPEENIRPWESGIQFLAEALKGFMTGFTDLRQRLYIGKGEGKVPPNMKSVSDVVTTTWDAVNDFPVGLWMDRRNFKENIHRWIMRFNATFSPLFILIQCFNFNLTPLQRIIEWTLVSMFADIMSTVNAVSETKISAGISPHAQQRSAIQLFRTLGGHAGNFFAGFTIVLMGLKDVLGVTDYQIMIWGAIMFAPLTIFSRWLPSFAKQRVDFTVKVQGEEGPEKEKRFTLRESFAVVKHNKWFMMWLVINMVKVVMPTTDELFVYRFLMPKLHFRGKELGGELLYTLKSTLSITPAILLSPFARQAVKKFGGEMNFLKGHAFALLFVYLSVYLVGYNTFGKFAFMIAMYVIRAVMDLWAPVPHQMMEYKMYDYVEWKTGLRSEGMTKSVDGLLNKLVKNNLNSVIGNAVLDWTGFLGYDVPVEQQPRRFLHTIWPLMHWGMILGQVVTLIALFVVKMPHNFDQVEADLIERRARAAKLKEEGNV
ncbi:MAG: MFS transporter [Oscillospiraceae bacterium]|jgi:Na+/melibiose symporter-like transporter|nr:MFS transporter [Oscillospiraceae bacterium]